MHACSCRREHLTSICVTFGSLACTLAVDDFVVTVAAWLFPYNYIIMYYRRAGYY